MAFRLKNQLIMKAGEMNDFKFSGEVVKSTFDELQKLDPESDPEARKIFVIEIDHAGDGEEAKSVVGFHENHSFDEELMGIRADLVLTDPATAAKVESEIEERGFSTFAISPTLDLVHEEDGTVVEASFAKIAMVIDPAGGEDVFIDTDEDSDETDPDEDEEEMAETETVENAEAETQVEMNLDLLIEAVRKAVADGATGEDVLGLMEQVKEQKDTLDASEAELAADDDDEKDDEDDEDDGKPFNKDEPDPKPELETTTTTIAFDQDGVCLQLEGSSEKFEGTSTPTKFRKELIRVGQYVDPRGKTAKLEITKERMAKWKEDFGIKRVPITIRHSQDPRKCVGWVKDIRTEGDKVFALMDFTNKDIAAQVAEGSIKDVSPGIDPNYTDTKTGRHIGEVLDHVAITITPHITNLDEFEPIAAEDLTQKELVLMERQDDTTATVDDKDQVLELEQLQGKVISLETEKAETQERMAFLEKREIERGEKDVQARIETCIRLGKVKPTEKDEVEGLALEMYGAQPLNFESTDEKPGTLEKYLISLENRAPAPEFGDAKGGSEPQKKGKKYLLKEEILGLEKGEMSRLKAEGKILCEKETGAAYWADVKSD